MAEQVAETSGASSVVCSICESEENVLDNPNCRLKAYLRNHVPGYEGGAVCHGCYVKLVEPKSNPADDTLNKTGRSFQENIIVLSSSQDSSSSPRESNLSAPMLSNRRVRETPEWALFGEISARDEDDLRERGVPANDMPRNNDG